MKQTERDQRDQEKITQGAGAAGPENAKESAGGEQPRSWRKYIEEAEAAEKRAEREAAKARAAQAKKEKHSPAALTRRARAALNGASLKERAGQNARNLRSAAGDGWDRVCSAAAGGRERLSQAAAKVRGVVERHPISPLLYLTVAALAVCAAVFNGSYTRAYALAVNGQEVGVVSSPDEKDAIVSGVESRASDILGERYDYNAEISMTPVYVTPDALSDAAQIEETLFQDVGALTTAYGLRVEIGRAHV